MSEAVRSAQPIFGTVTLRHCLVGALGLTALMYGATEDPAQSLMAIAFAVLSLVGLSMRQAALSPGARVVAQIALAIVGMLMAWALFQSVPLTDTWMINQAWRDLHQLIDVGSKDGYISVAPGTTWRSVPALAIPFCAFLAALSICGTEQEAVRLWRNLAQLAITMAVFGLLQHLLFPDFLLLEPKRYYVGSLTGTFVNRNTAGTFLGTGAVIALSLAFFYLRRLSMSHLRKRLEHFAWRTWDDYSKFAAFAAATGASLLALFLTQSRGAVGATFVALILQLTWTSQHRLTARRSSHAVASRWTRVGRIGAMLVIVLGLFAIFSGRATYRLQVQGVEDSRWCAFESTFQAIGDNWLLGTGFATFPDVFPRYRNADCAGIDGVWDIAHNTFLEAQLGFGIMFVPLCLLGYATLAFVFARGIRQRRRERYIPVAAAAILVLATLHALIDFSFQIPGYSVFFAAVMAVGVTISLRAEAQRRTKAGRSDGALDLETAPIAYADQPHAHRAAESHQATS